MQSTFDRPPDQHTPAALGQSDLPTTSALVPSSGSSMTIVLTGSLTRVSTLSGPGQPPYRCTGATAAARRRPAGSRARSAARSPARRYPGLNEHTPPAHADPTVPGANQLPAPPRRAPR